MGIRHYTYKDIPTATRAKASSEAQKQLQSVLASPVTSPEQRNEARRQQLVIAQWASGTLPNSSDPEGDSEPSTPPTGTDAGEVISLSEAVAVVDGASDSDP